MVEVAGGGGHEEAHQATVHGQVTLIHTRWLKGKTQTGQVEMASQPHGEQKTWIVNR